MSWKSDQAADLTDRQRVWEVRRFCQVKNAFPPTGCGVDSKGDAALSALLRCLLYELDADLAAITLLDEQTQHFLSVVHKSDLNDPSVQSTKWYGCEQIEHRGGICEKTITLNRQADTHPVYEILDLSSDATTQALPIVDGTVADFRHYAGVPLNTPDGLNVGTVFVFRKQAPEGLLSPEKSAYICQTAQHAMTQLLKTVQATENQRSLRCNSAVSSMLDEGVASRAHSSNTVESPKLYTSFAANIYATAADLLLDAFDLEGVIVQELPPSNAVGTFNRPVMDKVLAKSCNAGIQMPRAIKDAVAQKLVEDFPLGAIFHVLRVDETTNQFVASVQGKQGSCLEVQLDLCGEFPRAEQIMFMPLRDSFHDRDVSFILGWATDFKRVYSSTTDLPPLSSFGMAIMTQVRRLEAQMLSRNKSDFLGSMSHEMRSPLHGMMACIDLLLQDTQCSAQQLDLLQSAEACGLQLRGNIDNILLYSNIGSPSPRPNHAKRPSFPDHQEDVSQGKNNMLTLIEETIEREARKRKSTLPSEGVKQSLLWTNDNPIANRRAISTVITVDASPQADFPLARYSGISVIINNLLGNCIKFTGPDACIRVSLETDDGSVKLKFADAGRGMTNDFVRHNLLVPFAQQNPLDTGTGLGLALVQRAVQALEGETKIETDESRGTEVSVTIPKGRLIGDVSNANGVTASPSTSTEMPDYSSLTVRLLTPTRWQEAENLRQERCLDSLSGSLARTLHTWLKVDCRAWAESDDLPDVMFLLHTDIERLRALAKDSFDSVQKVILCPDTHAEAALQDLKPGTFTTIVGPVTSSKVCATVTSCLHSIVRRREHYASSRQGSTTSQSTNITNESHEDLASIATSATEQETEADYAPSQTDVRFERELPDRTAKAQPEQPADPRFLLVDDNAINLKVIGMYAKKCSKQPSTSASGGQEAIDVFTAAALAPPDEANSKPAGYDIILLDLSMPEVSGFDVAAAIRKLERDTGSGRTYIAALTGLVSDKDRAAAFAAGVDEYVTKPATVKDIQSVITNWRALREAPP